MARTKATTVETMSISADKKINLTKFLTLYPQKSGVAAMLKGRYSKSFFTVAEWNEKIAELLGTKI